MYVLFTLNEMRKIRAKKKRDYRARNMQCVFRFGFFSSFVIISVGTGGGDLSFRLFLDAQFSPYAFPGGCEQAINCRRSRNFISIFICLWKEDVQRVWGGLVSPSVCCR